jgi:hypothetical protein
MLSGMASSEPHATRPHMPGYGVVAAGEGSGLLPWTWALDRVIASHDYWLATVRPDGRPHLMPVWAVWDGAALWFSSARGSRKAINLRAHPRCSIATDNAFEPVIVEGDAIEVTDEPQLRAALDLENAKYDTDYGDELIDTATNSWFRLQPIVVFGLDEDDFTGSPTRWSFAPPSH